MVGMRVRDHLATVPERVEVMVDCCAIGHEGMREVRELGRWRCGGKNEKGPERAPGAFG